MRTKELTYHKDMLAQAYADCMWKENCPHISDTCTTCTLTNKSITEMGVCEHKYNSLQSEHTDLINENRDLRDEVKDLKQDFKAIEYRIKEIYRIIKRIKY